jgi:hypothetical protein
MRLEVIISSCLLLLVLAMARPGEASPQWREEGPRSLIITYKTEPAHKSGFLASVRSSVLPKLQRLRASGDLSTYHVLTGRYLDSEAWDVMLILDFADSAALARWRAVESHSPGGLDSAALKLVSEVATAPADCAFAGKAPSEGNVAPVYLVIPYEYLVSADKYLTYAQGYVVPQMEGWLQSGALQSYGLYLPRYSAGRLWNAELVLAYRGDAGLARRDAVVEMVRSQLAATSPEWKSFADSKAQIRVEKQAVIADELNERGSN